MRVTYKPQPQSHARPRPSGWRTDDIWDLTPTIDVYDAGRLPNPIGFAPWPKAPAAETPKGKTPRKRRRSWR